MWFLLNEDDEDGKFSDNDNGDIEAINCTVGAIVEVCHARILSSLPKYIKSPVEHEIHWKCMTSSTFSAN